MKTLADPDAPCVALDRARLDRNLRRLDDQLAGLGVPLRLHVKTAKSTEVAARAFGGGTGPITVSTLAEAEHFAAAGYTDVLYTVGIVPEKLPRVAELLRRGVRLTAVLDSAEQARAVAPASRAAGVPIPALVEIDCDGHRAGRFAPSRFRRLGPPNAARRALRAALGFRRGSAPSGQGGRWGG